MSFSVRRLLNPTEEELDKTADALARAFNYSYFLSALGGKRELVAPFLRAHVNATLLGGEVYVVEAPTDGIVGGALWFGPGQKFLSTVEQHAAGWDDIMSKIDTVYRAWWDNFLQEYDALCENCFGSGVKLSSYHLQVFGVVPDYQRRGFGRALITATEDKAKLKGESLCLETMGTLNIGIYQSMGFVVAGSGPAGKSPKDTDMVFTCLIKHTKTDVNSSA